MTILQILGFDKCYSNEIFTIKRQTSSSAAATNNNKAATKQAQKPILVLKQSKGFAKEHAGISKVYDTTEHSTQEFKKVLTSTLDASESSPVSLFVNHTLNCNVIFLTGNPGDVEQKRNFFNLRADITEAIFAKKQEDIYVGMTALLGTEALDMLNVVQR